MFEGHCLKGHSLFIAHGSMVVGEREILLEDFEGGGDHTVLGEMKGGKNIERGLLTANSDPRQGIEENCNTTQPKLFSDFLLPTPRR